MGKVEQCGDTFVKNIERKQSHWVSTVQLVDGSCVIKYI